jgi:hypothetical protein
MARMKLAEKTHLYIKMIIERACVYSIETSLIVYVFSLLNSRQEFIIVSLVWLIFVQIIDFRIEYAGKTASMVIFILAILARVRSLNKETERSASDLKAFDEVITERVRIAAIGRNADRIFLVIVSVYCLLELFNHLNSSFVEAIIKRFPPDLRQIFP